MVDISISNDRLQSDDDIYGILYSLMDNTIVIQPYDWQFRDPDVYVWGLDRESIPNLVVVKNIPIFCFLDLPNILWTRLMINTLSEWFMQRPETIRPIQVRFVRMLKLYYYNDTKYPMLLVVFSSLQSMRNAVKYITKVNYIDGIGPISFTPHETTISPIRKLWTLSNIHPCQWLTITDCTSVKEENKVSTIDREYIARWENIQPVIDNNNIVDPSILSFDIECYSDNDRIFSNPMLANHVVFMVSVIHRSKGQITKYLITTLDCNIIDDVTIYHVNNEIELCRRFEKLVCDLNPDVVIGYNIFGYDYRYLNTRLRRRNLEWGNLGRLYNEKTDLIEVGSRKYTYLSMSGRISLDLLTLIRKDFKLVKYDLNTVSLEILGRGKHDVKPHEMFSIYRSRNIDGVTRIARYCIQDAILVIDLFDKLSIWYGLVELSNVVGVPIKDLYVYGQQIRCLSQIYDICAKNSIVIDEPPVKSDTMTKYKGGFVFDPKVGLHEHIICLDFKSLYPSIIQAFNICYSTYVVDPNINDNDCNIIEWDEGNIHHRYRFIKPDIRKGILPILVEKLVDERNQVRKKMESIKDPLIRNILDKRQLALKVSANAIYGFLGVSEGILSLIECAMSVTAKGREMIRTCQKYLESKYNANVVYGDTDSIMFSIDGVDYTNINEWGKRMQSEITSLFPRPLSTEFEKAGMILCLRKKHYAFWPVGFKPGGIIYRGITLARRDKFPYHKKVYGKVIDMILTKRPVYETYEYIIESVKNLLTRQVPVSDLVIVKEVGRSYKSDTYSIKVFEEKMARQGVIINAGDRIEYVITVGNGLLGERMVLVDRYQGELIDYYYYITKLMMKSIDTLFYIGYHEVIDQMLSQYNVRDYNLFLRYVHRYIGGDYIDEGYIKGIIYSNSGCDKTSKLIRSLWRYVTKTRVVLRVTDKPIANFSRYIDLRMKCMQELKCRWMCYYRSWLDQQSMNPPNLSTI